MREIDLQSIRWEEQFSRLAQTSTLQRVATGAIFFLMVILLGLVFFWKPAVDELTVRQEEIDRTMLELEKKSMLVMELAETRHEVQQLRALLPTLVAGFPERQKVPELLSTLHDRLSKSGLALDYFRPGKPVNGDAVDRLPIEVRLEGTDRQMVMLPPLLAGLSRKINMGDFKMTRSKESGLWVFEGTINAYFQRQPMEAEPGQGQTEARGVDGLPSADELAGRG